MNEYNLIEHVKTAVVFSLLGILLFGIVWFVVVKVSPFSIRKELEEDQNTALGILLGCLILGISIIVAAAIHG
jgi:uncharacterized membrane protein YjfL (UPF0719 family)